MPSFHWQEEEGRVHNEAGQDILYLGAGKEILLVWSNQAPDLCKFVLYPVVHAKGKPNPAVQK